MSLCALIDLVQLTYISHITWLLLFLAKASICPLENYRNVQILWPNPIKCCHLSSFFELWLLMKWIQLRLFCHLQSALQSVSNDVIAPGPFMCLCWYAKHNTTASPPGLIAIMTWLNTMAVGRYGNVDTQSNILYVFLSNISYWMLHISHIQIDKNLLDTF